ncbi:MAG: oxidoreductase [Alteromonadaceae bacterium]|uniref:SDR family NAD(P)-dependent oxidoreductase n=1 Tax=Paraglaciecola chathamensis TaxID=368405 RepID=UPI000C3B796B|nr:SDR family NAD(P)-dependent oxidoreductase [Paraglaciecola agarilytica]MBN27828.1 oxidoreductase [Alteromonadaceae bacterium]|tara:strand:+ start:7840 stop:8634 length:795 start_codon:yes stop_codon:yes gene_type:complete
MQKKLKFNQQKGERLVGKVALVTGAGSGIGKGCALMFARQGATVIATDINQESLLQTQQEAEKEGLKIHVMGPVDLLNEADVNSMLIRLISQHKNLHILVNAAATAVFNWIEDLSYADWQLTLRAELDSVFLVCKATWPHLKQSGASSIINFASANAYVALQGSPALAHCAGKGGVLAMTRQLAMEGGPFGLRANTIAPGMIVTGATKPVLEQPGLIDNVMAKNMLKRLGQPEDIAWCAVYLASDESSYVTGADFAVDAGAKTW